MIYQSNGEGERACLLYNWKNLKTRSPQYFHTL